MFLIDLIKAKFKYILNINQLIALRAGYYIFIYNFIVSLLFLKSVSVLLSIFKNYFTIMLQENFNLSNFHFIYDDLLNKLSDDVFS